MVADEPHRPQSQDIDNGNDIDTVIKRSSATLEQLPVDLEGASNAFSRTLKLAALSGEFGRLVEGDVWSTTMGDWAMFVNGSVEHSQIETYAPWGQFKLEPLTMVVFRVGHLVGAADEARADWLRGPVCSEQDLYVEALEDRLGREGVA